MTVAAAPTPPRLPPQARVVVAAYLLAGLAAVALMSPGLALATVLNGLNALLFLHAAWAAWRRASGATPARATWSWFAVGFGSQAFCQAIPVATALLARRLPPFPSYADAFALAALGAFIAGLIAWPEAARGRSQRLRLGLDGTGAGLGVLFLGWSLALGPLFHPQEIPRIVKVATLLFLLGNAVILGLVFYLARGRWGRLKGPLGWVGLGFLLSVIQSLGQVPLSLRRAYYLGHPIDLLVVAAGVALLLATLDPLEPARAPEVQDSVPEGSLAPLLPVLVCMPVGALILALDPARWDRPLIAIGLVMVSLVLARMYLALRDLQALSRDLDARVQARSRDLERAQGLIVRTERMNALASIGAGLAHDLKNHLGVMKNYALLLDQDLRQGRPPQPADLEAIRMAADQAGLLANQLMAFGREEEAGAGGAFELTERLQHLLPLLRSALPAYVALEGRLPRTPMALPGDPARFDQILVNLVLNARDAIHASGRILVEIQACSLGTGRPGALLIVSDSGSGMSEEVQARIFEPFFTTKPSGSGTGLGLASVRSQLDQMGGEIEVHSVPGKGTTFLIRLPLAPAEATGL